MEVHPKRFILNWANELTDAFVRAERDMVRPLDRGAPREEALKQLLQSFLPGRYGVTSGHVVSALPAWSRQADVIIYNALECPVLSRQGGFQGDILPLEGVHGIVEVKSTLTEQDFQDALDKIAEFKGMRGDQGPSDLSTRRFGGMFFFRLPPDVEPGSVRQAKLLESCRERSKKIKQDLLPDLGIILGGPDPKNEGVSGGKLFLKDSLDGGLTCTMDEGQPALPIFLHLFLEHVRSVPTGYPELFWYLFDKRDFVGMSETADASSWPGPNTWGQLDDDTVKILPKIGGKCPVCKSKKWSTQRDVFVLPRMKETKVGSVTPPAFSAVALVCGGCGHVSLFSMDAWAKAVEERPLPPGSQET